MLLLLSPGLLSSQQRSSSFGISATPLNSRVAIGEIGTLIVKITGGDAEVPQTLEVPGLEVTHSGEDFKGLIIAGVQTIEMTHFYRFSGDTPGTYTIPSIPIRLGSDTFESDPVEITIYERDQNETIDATKPFFARFELSKTDFYVNEVVPLTLTAYVRGRGSIQDVLPPRLAHESFIIKSFRDVQTDGAEQGNSYYTSATMPSNLFALKEGDHRLGPATLGVRINDNSGSSFGFGAFFSRTVNREMTTNTVNVTVKPLPRGAPPSFSGGVGRFELIANASTSEVNLGDPISMEFLVTGSGNFETLGAPEFQVPPTDIWKSYEPSKQIEGAEGEGSGSSVGQALFSRVIIPEAKVSVIPSFELSYFDPEAEKYVTLETPEIPITVREDERASSAPTTIRFPAGGPETTGAPGATTPSPQFDDILHIRTSPPHWISLASLEANSTWFYLVQAFFSISFFTILGFGVIRWVKQRSLERGDVSAVLTYRQALKRLPGAGAPKRDFYHAVSTSLILWRDENPEAPGQVLEIVNRISDRCETILYSGAARSAEMVSPSDVNEVLPILQKLAKK
ncbi:MAG: BatD family protein [Verrucomicrobiota bacterium]